MAGRTGTTQGAGQGPANPDVSFAPRGLPKHRVEGNELLNVDRLQIQLFGNPDTGLVRDRAKLVLNEMNDHESGASLLRVTRNDFFDFPQRLFRQFHDQRAIGRILPLRSRDSRGSP